MKKKLLKPPLNDGEFFFFPQVSDIWKLSKSSRSASSPHQPYFFNPGVSAKILFTDLLPCVQKEILFIDTDRIRLSASLPSKGMVPVRVDFLSSEETLSKKSSPTEKETGYFFDALESHTGKKYPCLSDYREILFKHLKEPLLKDVLAKSFLEFYDLKKNYIFLSDVLKTEAYKEFFFRIFHENEKFREIFNQVLDEFRMTYRFRYKNFPYPKLEAGELPFWIVRDGKRHRCFKKDIEDGQKEVSFFFPRAVALTIFLRLYRVDLFIHGIGGGNYEWVHDRIIERFFKKDPPIYGIVSATFTLDEGEGRDYPFFLYSPEKVKNTLHNVMNAINK